MPDDRTAPDGTMEAFREHIRIAARRYRLERFAQASWPLAWGVAGALLVLLLAAMALSLEASILPIALALLVIGGGLGLAILQARVNQHRLFVQIDAHGRLPDSVLSAGDWESAALDPWRERQRAETLLLLEKVDWRQTWPVRWPKLLWMPLVTSAILLAVLGMVQRSGEERQRAANLVAQQENAPVAPEKLKPLEQVFQDWDAAQKIAPNPEMADLLKQIKPLRDQMASGEMTEKQLYLKLNEVQARIQAAKDRLDAGSLEPMAPALADVVKDLDGMSGLASALQRKDFAAARDQAAQAEKKYDSGAAKMPEGANAQAAASKLADAAQKASAANDAQTSSSLQQMQKGTSDQDGKEMSKGLDGLKDSLGQQAQKQAQSHNLGMQLSQLGDAKNDMQGEGGAGMKTGMPQLSLAKSLEEQKGAGTGVDPNRSGAATQIDASHQKMNITGTAGNGTSETQTESTKDPHFEQTAATMSAAQFAAYEKLSEQATEDENLPVADRQMIKRYFEDIRPKSNP